MNYALDLLQMAYNNNTMDNCPDDAITHICRLDGAIQQIKEAAPAHICSELDDALDACGYDGCDASGLHDSGFRF